MIDLSKNDSRDMKAILDQITTVTVPTEMKMLWDMQVQILSAKSSKATDGIQAGCTICYVHYT